MKPTDEREIYEIINKLGSNKSPGYDGIHPGLIKKVANEILSPLSIVFNISISTGIVPDALNIAKVVPIYKKDNSELFSNYRPVSVLP